MAEYKIDLLHDNILSYESYLNNHSYILTKCLIHEEIINELSIDIRYIYRIHFLNTRLAFI